MNDKYKKEFKEEIIKNIVQLSVKHDFLKSKLEKGTLRDDSKENTAKVKMDIDALQAKVEELQELADFIDA